MDGVEHHLRNGKNNIHYHLDFVLDFCRMEKREMNHDYAHCLDYTKDCPKECFRAELQRDIAENRSEFVGVPMTYAHLRGKEECELVNDTDVTDRNVGKWNGAYVKCEKNILVQQSVRAFELPCDGCKFVGTYDTDFPCSRCIRREKDYYEQE